ncbi:hypothetical protein ECC02_009928 [Trypanosoma cruzi]|uniref:Uncharacterized protein n=1 Tax=Trypanosoma cruzi TaxID=5693 RepID=A0A7J6XRU6_TRYCR|nr:hypothetical protein ECC02_009928 [Trypanosoma cruzi]
MFLGCVRDGYREHNAEHTAGQRKQMKQKTQSLFSLIYLHRNTTHAHKSPWLSAGTHSPHAPLYFTAVYASADTASSSGAHTHAELLRLPSISRRSDGARVVVVVGASVVVVVVGASGAVVVVVVVGAFVVVVVVVALDVCTLTDFSFSLDGVDSSFPGLWSPPIPFPSPAPGSVPGSCPTTGTVWTCDSEDDELKLEGLSSSVAAAHTDGQQHRASTNRAHSRRHVVIIVSVVVQWCGADLHSEGHGEQQGRREVRQTHTEGTPHEERGQQPGMHRTPHTTHDTHSNPRQHAHTHSPAAAPTHRWRGEKQTGAAHKAPPHAHTARAVRRVCSPHGGCAHTQEEVQRSQQHKSKITIKKRRSQRTTQVVVPREVQPIFITRNDSFAFGLRSYSAHTTSCKRSHHYRSSRTRNGKRKRKAVVWEAAVPLSLSPGFVVSSALAFVVGAAVDPAV